MSGLLWRTIVLSVAKAEAYQISDANDIAYTQGTFVYGYLGIDVKLACTYTNMNKNKAKKQKNKCGAT